MIAMETIEKLSREKLPKITVLAGEDLGQYSQAKEKFLKQIGFFYLPSSSNLPDYFLMLMSSQTRTKKQTYLHTNLNFLKYKFPFFARTEKS